MAENKIITPAHLAEEFGLSSKALRRKLRQMEESTKPSDGTPYQWYSDSEELAAIRERLQQEKAKRNTIR